MSLPLDPPVQGSKLGPGPPHRVVAGALLCEYCTNKLIKPRPRLDESYKKIVFAYLTSHGGEYSRSVVLSWDTLAIRGIQHAWYLIQIKCGDC